MEDLITKIEQMQAEARDGMKRASRDSDPYLYQYMVGKFHAFGNVAGILKKQKENPKSCDSIPSDCTADAKYEDRWHKATDSLPDNGREVLAKDKLGNTLLARYDGEGWDVSVYDDDDYRCHNGISKWCEIPSEKQKEQKPAEWSEEDEKMLEGTLMWLDDLEKQGEYVEKERLWLKSIRPVSKESLQPHWKPTEEQMKWLKDVIETVPMTCRQQVPLESLYNDLKTLM